MTRPVLFAVCLGGRAPGCNIELHDVVFAAGASIEDIHPQLLDRWFGNPERVHVDAWARVETVPGYRVQLKREAPDRGPRLYFVNIGAYAPGELLERHAYALYAGDSAGAVKTRAKAELLAGRDEVHRDDLYDVDDLLAVEAVDGWHVHLEPDPDAGPPEVSNGYFPIPRATVAAWLEARRRD
ncbi:DUF1543 domain-containing protein [Wenzhouxiangella sp. XN79A]|uniref:DUF1543 domain-containing protein n=1 Tax=Wenzhouxiangella sp. XN79A TaxID=2724193 RepID=UPI00144AF9A1|nr:DUF1543 domain-containing protein [Wenzhouxiangella sp. XN79A]NKI35212.1 DUF1543 domain-containing protein [Wenzhouxiangella sp. XN79A]